VDAAVATIVKAAKTGKIGDVKCSSLPWKAQFASAPLRKATQPLVTATETL